jgi:hypothetical protein
MAIRQSPARSGRGDGAGVARAALSLQGRGAPGEAGSQPNSLFRCLMMTGVAHSTKSPRLMTGGAVMGKPVLPPFHTKSATTSKPGQEIRWWWWWWWWWLVVVVWRGG